MIPLLYISLNILKDIKTMKTTRTNPIFGESYEISPTMEIFLSKLKEKQFLFYGLSLFTSEFIFGNQHLNIIDGLYKRSIEKLQTSTNTMNKYGSSDIIKNEEFEQIKKSLLSYIQEVYGIDPCKTCDLFKDFTVHYGFLRDGKLDEHIDDSDITINICLKNTKENTVLKFNSVPDTLFSIKRQNPVIVNLEKGDVLVHFGKQPHEVMETEQKKVVEFGERVNLILWLKFK